MKSLVVTLAVLVVVAYAASNSEWEQFKLIHKKSYSMAEDRLRREIFLANAEKVATHNRLFDLGLKSYRLGINRFSDMTKTEKSRFLGGSPPTERTRGPRHVPTGKVLATQVDWRSKNVVTDVKDQGGCGSCWAFSTTGSVESAHAIATGELIELSEQQLVDCTTVAPYNLGGCGGGFMNMSFQYIIDVGGIESEKDYPYEEQDDTCRFDKSKVAATISSYVNVGVGDEKALQDAVATVGPVSVAIEVEDSFYSYAGGVYYGDDCQNEAGYLNHGVLLVGYGSEDGKDFYIVKNSWNASWGEKGYVRMSRNRGDNCGIALAASYPVV